MKEMIIARSKFIEKQALITRDSGFIDEHMYFLKELLYH